jgi:hypothetical protein
LDGCRLDLQDVTGEVRGSTQLVFRPKLGLRLLRLVVGAVLGVVGLLAQAGGESGLAVVTLAAAGVSLGLAFLYGHFGIVLDGDGVTVQGFRTHRLAWHEVVAIQPTTFLGDLRTQVIPISGLPIRTHAPAHSHLAPDPTFTLKLALMQQYHLEQLGCPPPSAS